MDIAVKSPIVACGDEALITELSDDNYGTVFEEFIDKVFDVEGSL
jgi:hypothetical protein